MSNQNFEPIEIPDTLKDFIMDLVQQIKDKLPEGLVTLTAADRHQIPKMGDKTDAFCDKSHDFAVQITDAIPAGIKVNYMPKNKAAIVNLQIIKRAMDEITTKLDDSIMKSGSEIYITSLSIYKAIQDGAKRNIDGCKDAEAELKKRFIHHTKDTPPTDNPA